MTLDPFGDYATRGYLRNTRSADDVMVKRLELAAFRGALDSALDNLKSKSVLTYEDVLQTHATLFSSLYPWAGQDRTVTAPDSAIGKNGNFNLFAHPEASRLAVDQALGMAANRSTMRSKPGEIMGLLAYAHPFLDGNGRTIMIVHTELCRRAGMHINWSSTNKTEYLSALTRELEDPGKGHLDSYLKPFFSLAMLDQVETADTLRSLRGLGPADDVTPGRVLIPGREIDAAITRVELEKALGDADLYRESDKGLERMAAIVYRDPAEVINDVRAAAVFGEIGDRKVVSRINLDPESYGPYKGAGGVFSSTQERKDNRNAIAARTGLRGVADHLLSTAHAIRENLARDKQELADRGKVEVRSPNVTILHAIEKKQPISEAQAAEIDKAIRSFEYRFGLDVGRIRTARNLEPLAQKHGLDAAQLATARQVLKTLDKGQALAREQAQAVKQSQQIGKGGPTR